MPALPGRTLAQGRLRMTKAPQRGRAGVRAAFADAQSRLDRTAPVPDPTPDVPRVVDGVDTSAGQWPGAPIERLPPNCPVVPIGKDGNLTYVIDAMHQFRAISAKD